MPENRPERRLAAILAMNVAGYSRLMGTDEEGTLAQLKVHRQEFVDPSGDRSFNASNRVPALFSVHGTASARPPLVWAALLGARIEPAVDCPSMSLIETAENGLPFS